MEGRCKKPRGDLFTGEERNYKLEGSTGDVIVPSAQRPSRRPSAAMNRTRNRYRYLGEKGSDRMTTAFFRTLILYLILMVGLRLMGKRQIGELEPSELVLTLIISDLAAVPMQDFGIPLANGVFPIITLLCVSMLISFFSLKSIRFRGLVCGYPTVIIREGKILQQNMARNRFTVDELMEELRCQGYSDLSAVKYAVLETSGQVSVLPYTKDAPTTPKVLKLDIQDDVTLPVLVINDGRVMSDNLTASGHNAAWLEKQLKERKLTSPKQVFLMTVDESESVVCVVKEAGK